MPPIQPVDATSYIDHELSVNLDSTEAFEGPEKLLEIWFYQDKTLSKNSLRSISFNDWSNILDLVNCKILSIKSSSDLDAYLLSESSLFVYDHKLILKTCGQTTTLLCLENLFKLVNAQLNWNFNYENQPYRVFYSRRSYLFPNKQKSIHKNWNDEVAYLNQFFQNGSHYLIGRIDNNHWHLYTTLTEASPKIQEIDETFEILMTDLIQSNQFNTSRKPGFEIDGTQDLGHFLGNSTSNNTGLNNLYETDLIHDAFQFTPCGYSSNSIIKDSYYTLHVTPEKDWSYASFESNIDSKNNLNILMKVLNIFKPGKFQLNFFTNQYDNLDQFKDLNLKNYKRIDKIVYDLHHYQLLYISFELIEDTLLQDLKLE